MAGLFLLLAAFFALTGPGHSSSTDGLLMLLSARNLIETGSTSVPPIPLTEGMTRIRGIDGLGYPKFGPGLVLAHVPLLFAVEHLESLRPLADGHPVSSRARDEFYASFTNAWLMAAAVVGIAYCGFALGFDRAPSVWLAILTALGSPLWLYARSDSSEALQAAALIGALYFLLRERGALSLRGSVLSGALFGLLVAAKVVNLVLAPWFLLLVATMPSRASRLRVLTGFSLPVTVVCVLIGAFNYTRFGSPFTTGYEVGADAFRHPLLDGAFVLTLSPSFGLLTFFPASILVLLGARESLRRFPRESLLIAGVFGTVLLIYSKWWAYWGIAWGPRFLVPVIPLLTLTLLPLAATNGRRKMLLLATLLVGIPVQAIAVTSSFTQVMTVWSRLTVPEDRVVYESRIAPLRIGLWMLRNAACRTEEPRPPLTAAPWQNQVPWRDPETDLQLLRHLSGLDLWAVPDCWKPRAPSPASGHLATLIPASPPTRWLLLAVAALGAGLAISGRRAPAARESGASFHATTS